MLHTQTQTQPNQARPSISSTVQVCRCIGDSAQHIHSMCVCECVWHIDALQHRGVLARQRSFVRSFVKHVHGIFLYFIFFPFVGSSNDAITYVYGVHKGKSKLLFERYRRLKRCVCVCE